MAVTDAWKRFLDGFSPQRSLVLYVLRVGLNGLPPAYSRRGLHGHLSIHTRLPRRGRDQLRQRCAAHSICGNYTAKPQHPRDPDM